MMQIVLIELKKVMKARSTKLSMLVLLVIIALLGFAVIGLERNYYLDESGQDSERSGTEAIQANRVLFSRIEGAITSDKFRDAFIVCNEVFNEYGTIDIDNIPLPVYFEKMIPIELLLKTVNEVFVDPQTGIPLSREKITPKDAESFYSQQGIRLEQYLTYRYPNQVSGVEFARTMSSRVQTPFTYYYGIGDSNMLDYLILSIFLLVLICTTYASSVYSGDYHTGADDILRCSKHGRTKLGLSKLIATFIQASSIYFICIAIYLCITISAFGIESLQTSMQMVYSSISFWPLTVRDIIILTVTSGLLSLFATISFTLFISACFRKPTFTLAAAIGICLLPIVLGVAASGVEPVDWIRLILPSGGIGFGNSFLYELTDFQLLSIGSLDVWTPFINPVACIIEALLFGTLAIHIYSRHEVA